jgi:hypothetical protein
MPEASTYHLCKRKDQYEPYSHNDMISPLTARNGTQWVSAQDPVLSYDQMVKKYGSKVNLYQTLNHFYSRGRNIANPRAHVHGHQPEYDHTSSKHDQYIRHTEQMMVAYLALPEAATMLVNRLRIAIRGEYPDVVAVKTYNMGLHMHSTKTCCAPCEYSLIGLMNDNGTPFVRNRMRLGFLPNFMIAAPSPNQQLTFNLPRNSLFRIVVTVTASNKDAHHQSQPNYMARQLQPKDPIPPYVIRVKDAAISSKIFTTMLDVPFDPRRLPSSTNVRDHTVGISGSKATPGSPSTMDKVKSLRDDEADQLGDKLSLLKVKYD